MRFRSPVTTTALRAISATVSRHFSAAAPKPRRKGRCLGNIHHKYKSRALSEAQKALTDYLHTTRVLPYVYAEQISTNSPFMLSAIVSKLHFSCVTFSKTLNKYFLYNPINEFEFFLESIGICPSQLPSLLPHNKFFFFEDSRALDVAGTLYDFGFPWKMLGGLYLEEVSIFGMKGEDLTERLYMFKVVGFNNVSVIGICLAFPHLLKEGCDRCGLFNDLKSAFIDYDLMGTVREDVEASYEVCKKIKVFYAFGCEEGKTGDMLGRSKHIFHEYSVEVLVEKAKFFSRLGAEGRNVGILLLEKPDIFSFELESSMISTMGILKHLGLCEDKIEYVARDYPYVFGRHRIANLPSVMRASNLHEWFFDKIKNENHKLLAHYTLTSPDEDESREFSDNLERIRLSRTTAYKINKINFITGIGFGENPLTLKVLKKLHGSSLELQERFDVLLNKGVNFSNACKMTALEPKILTQHSEALGRKIDYLLEDMGMPMQNLVKFPSSLCFHLEDRIKPRNRFHLWLVEMSLTTKCYSFGSIIATSDKNFMHRLRTIHPALPKHWLERFFLRES